MKRKLLKQHGLPARSRLKKGLKDLIYGKSLSNEQTSQRQFTNLRGILRKTVSIASVLVLTSLVACSYRSAAPEAPAPSEQIVDKSFFMEGSQPKTFLCGWAAEGTAAGISEHFLLGNMPLADHCNMVFNIEENYLIGKMINPSFPDDSSKWTTIVTIPIASHFYYEKEKDARGRETPNYIENSQRSHWSARPKMRLNLAGIQIHKWSYGLIFGNTGRVVSVEDIEWDNQRNFLGFTVNSIGTIPGLEEIQGKFRINFLAFKHNPNFKRTPFDDKNYRYMNVLHVMGKKINGTHQVMSAAHWDLSRPHDIYLQGFPPEYEPIGEKVVKDWNEALIEVGALDRKAVSEGRAGFIVKKSNRKHPFDLRYTSMVWVSDERVAQNAPLGVAMAHADVRNGEILWGGITLWGGFLETYIRMHTSNQGGIGQKAKSLVGSLARLVSNRLFPKEIQMPDSLQKVSQFNRMTFSNDALEKMAAALNQDLSKTSEANFNKQISQMSQQARETLLKQKAMGQMGKHQISTEQLNKIFEGLQKFSAQWAGASSSVPLTHIKSQIFPDISSDLDQGDETFEAWKKSASKDGNIQRAIKKHQGNIACTERTFEHLGHEWSLAFSQSKVPFEEVMGHVVTELISHEYGHFLGLGHQFKENILPEPDSVPKKYYDELAAKATEAEGYTNMTSVMGYRSPMTEVLHKEEVLPGPHDKLVLQYLYNRKYATYKKGDVDFTFFDVPESGIIPEKPEGHKELKTSYFPQCNDVEATVGFDPYCNRFDRGHNAVEIVKNYFDTLDRNLVQSLFAMTDSRSTRAEYAEAMLWWRSVDNLSRVRIFYDYMRLKYKNQIDKFKNDEQALFEFSTACQAHSEEELKNIKSRVLVETFKAYPEFKELCQANALALTKMKELVSINATDFTKIDKDAHFFPGGIDAGEADRNWSKAGGSWVELTAFPLKFMSLYTLTAPAPLAEVEGWWGLNFYNDPNMKYSYSSLYPQEYTQIMAENVRSNLKFATLSQEERTVLGRPVLSMIFFNYLNMMNNDRFHFPDRYLNQIANQMKFDFNVVAVIISGAEGKKPNDPNRVVRFDGRVFDFNTNETSSIGDVFLLPDGELIARGENSFLLPMTRLTLLNDTSGYVLAIRASYYKEHNDSLEKISMKAGLQNLYNDVLNACVNGANGKANGLSLFFTSAAEADDEFKGFYMPPGLAQDEVKYGQFLDSISENFNAYYNSKKFAGNPPRPETCREALRGAAMIVSTAAVVNGFWIPPIMDLIQK